MESRREREGLCLSTSSAWYLSSNAVWPTALDNFAQLYASRRGKSSRGWIRILRTARSAWAPSQRWSDSSLQDSKKRGGLPRHKLADHTKLSCTPLWLRLGAARLPSRATLFLPFWRLCSRATTSTVIAHWVWIRCVWHPLQGISNTTERCHSTQQQQKQPLTVSSCKSIDGRLVVERCGSMHQTANQLSASYGLFRHDPNDLTMRLLETTNRLEHVFCQELHQTHGTVRAFILIFRTATLEQLIWSPANRQGKTESGARFWWRASPP